MKKYTKVIVIISLVVLAITIGTYIWINKTMDKVANRVDDGVKIENILKDNLEDNNLVANEVENSAIQNEAENTVINETANIATNAKIANAAVMQKKNTTKIEEEDKEKVLPVYKTANYGTSENGRNLSYHSIAPEKYENTLLFVFAIHGYEDAYDKDAKVLVNTAKYLVDYYKTNDVSLLHNNRLLIVECANPDGLYDGKSNNGYGRCNAKGIDLNRDFDVEHKVFTSSRNYTTAPFSGKESKALADLIKKEKPTVVIDFHGWENCTIGDGNLAKMFKENMSLKHKTEFNNNCNGYFSYWAHTQGASALLVEFKDDNISRTNLRMAVDDILEAF